MRQVHENKKLETVDLTELETISQILIVRARLIAPAAARIAPSLPYR